MAEYNVRRGTSADFDAVRALHSAVAAEGLWLGSEAPVEWTPERIESWRCTADDESLGAWFLAEEADAIGYLALTRSRGGPADFAMAVVAAHRGRGVGGALLDASVAWCRERSVAKLACQVWPHNGGAIALYRSRGFAVEGRLRRNWRRRNGELWDAVVMGLVLDEDAPGSGLADAGALG
jgi:RimJ/RimL family protein N-acetyltransferase